MKLLQNLSWAALMLLILLTAVSLDNPADGPSPSQVRAIP